MKKISLQFRFLITIISAILAVTIFVGGLSLYEVDNYIQKETRNLIEITSENEATKINNTFESMEKSVKLIEHYVLSFFESAEDVENQDKQETTIQFANKMFVNVAKDTNGAIAYYLRFAPEISNSTTGIFYSKVDGGDEYVCFEPTDLSLYDKNDTEHVGWYWQPYEAGKPIWMMPYYNQNNNFFMISYVVPLYYEDLFLGVVGMDFDYTVLTEIIHNIKIYENGFAHLELNNMIIHAPSENTKGTVSHENSKDYLRSSKVLTNGMTLVLFADYDEIRHIRYEIAFKILFILLFFAFIFSFFAIFSVKRIVKPLKELTDASVKLSMGNYDVDIAHSNIQEIYLLSTAFENMLMNLREHKKLQHLLSHRDSLTGLRNTTSYKRWVADFNQKIQEDDFSFGVAVFDVNNLKKINDTYGHILGDELITTTAKIVSDTFKRSPVFRIGGDEFCVILQNKDLANKNELFENFDSQCAMTYIENGNLKIPVSIAKGFSKFDCKTDSKFIDVFKRADNEMYKNKRDMKNSSN